MVVYRIHMLHCGRQELCQMSVLPFGLLSAVSKKTVAPHLCVSA